MADPTPTNEAADELRAWLALPRHASIPDLLDAALATERRAGREEAVERIRDIMQRPMTRANPWPVLYAALDAILAETEEQQR